MLTQKDGVGIGEWGEGEQGRERKHPGYNFYTMAPNPHLHSLLPNAINSQFIPFIGLKVKTRFNILTKGNVDGCEKWTIQEKIKK